MKTTYYVELYVSTYLRDHMAPKGNIKEFSNKKKAIKFINTRIREIKRDNEYPNKAVGLAVYYKPQYLPREYVKVNLRDFDGKIKIVKK